MAEITGSWDTITKQWGGVGWVDGIRVELWITWEVERERYI